MTVELFIQDIANFPDTPSVSQFDTWVTAALTGARQPDIDGELTIRLIDTEESAHLNETYRHKSGPTNILSFDYEQGIGDLAICAPLVKDEALRDGIPLQAHWAHLVVHGVLHLLGYDHVEDEQAVIMESLETKILDELGFNNPYEL